MGMCLSCFGGAADDIVTPDPAIRRQQLADAAEKRQKEKRYIQSRRRHAKVRARQHTGESKIQKQLKGKGKNRRKQKNKR